MCGQGFDTWVLEVRGAGLSMQGSDCKEVEKSAHEISEKMEVAADNVTNETLSADQLSSIAQINSENPETAVASDEPSEVTKPSDEPRLVTEVSETFTRLSEGPSGFLSEGQSKIMSGKFFDQISKLLEDTFTRVRFSEIRAKFLSLLETKQNSGVAGQIKELSQKLVDIIDEERLSTTVDDFQKQLDLIIKYDWDFDHYLEEDIPAVMEYIRAQTKPKDGRLLAIGHSMGGILLYAMLSRYSSEGRDPGLAAVVTLASSLDYTSSKLILHRLLMLPVIPLGALLSAAYPLSSRPPYVLSWMNDLISAQDMMHPELLKKLILNNFYTVKLIPEHLVTYKVFGEPDGPHYAHYDLVGGRMAVEQIYPCIIEFLSRHDSDQ
ncbi:hypothetical protein PHJA_000612800 [Phtheirospermum japonicum]|uniref:Uncharacterized protein n=1 Tax=Phtheirospermum japonicum TaxID=374723 RepID=A0A830BH22_9LAMI|nr:hypothetical protein PHJA_000612800 [Phtheirospermum japonicum]